MSNSGTFGHNTLDNMFSKEVYQQRRDRLKKEVGNGLIVLLGNQESSINFKHNTYAFRQDSSFLYFFGIDRPGLCGLIDIDNDEDIIFGDDPGIDETVFLGDVDHLESFCEKAGISTIYPSQGLEGYIKKFDGEIHYLPPYRPENVIKLASYLDQDPGNIPDRVSLDLIRAVVNQRSYKSTEEIAEIEKAVDLTIDMQKMAREHAVAGTTEAQIAAKIQSHVEARGCRLSFPTILTVDGHVLHNYYKGNTLKNGDMLLVDCGAETKRHYAGDLTRTFPVGTGFTTRQKEMYEIVKHAHDEAVTALKPGVRFLDIHLLAAEKLGDGLKMLGLMKGDIREAVQLGAHTLFFQCGVGHMMGLDVHDMEDLGEQFVGYTDDLHQSDQFGLKSLRMGRAVEPGFVLTVEPGLYFIPKLIDLWKAEKKLKDFINYDEVEKYRNFTGIRIENDFLITEEGNRQLGKGLAY